MQTDCSRSIEVILSNFQLAQHEPFFDKVYLPTAFQHQEREQVMSWAEGIEGCRVRYPTILDFWVYALFSFLEVQIRDMELEAYARRARCEVVDVSVMYKRMKDCIGKLQPRFSVSFAYEGDIVVVYQMLDGDELVSFAVETTKTYYAFFWESLPEDND